MSFGGGLGVLSIVCMLEFMVYLFQIVTVTTSDLVVTTEQSQLNYETVTVKL